MPRAIVLPCNCVTTLETVVRLSSPFRCKENEKLDVLSVDFSTRKNIIFLILYFQFSPIMSFNIMPVMYEEANLDALYALSKKHITSTRFFHLLTVDNEEEYEPWLDLIDVVVAQGVAGFQQIESILRAHNPSAQSKSFTLIFRS
jgi:hypothetical protein